MKTFNNVESVGEFFRSRDFFVFQKSEQKIRNVFGPVGPAALLFVLVFHGLPKTRRDVGVHGDEKAQRDNLPVAVKIKETLIKNA